MRKEKELIIKVKQWLTKPDFTKNNPIPMRIMAGYIERETAKAYLVHLHGKPMPTKICLHCGRKLEHPVSLLYGIGPICMGHFHMNPFETEEELNAAVDELRKNMADITWTGWIPKSGVEEIQETGEFLEIADSSQKENKTNDNPSNGEKSKSQPAGQSNEPNKAETKPKYTLDITDKLVERLYAELERNL